MYFGKSRLKGADSASFQVIGPYWGKDSKSVYYGSTRLAGADPATFAILSSHNRLATDGTRYFDGGTEIPREQAYPHGSRIPGYPLGSAKNKEQIVDYLCRGATPQDRMALHAACGKGDMEIIKILLDAGCDPRIADPNPCLSELYCKNYMEVARLLFQAGANVNQVRAYSPFEPKKEVFASHHPLESALHARRFDLAEFLISAGSDINTETSEGQRLINHFRRLGNMQAVDYLKEKGAIDL